MRLRDRILERFADFAYRHSYVDTFVDSYLATQIKALREQRHFTQQALAERAGMKQSQISRLEDVDNSSWQIRTLKKLAKAFDLVLVVRFESFGNVLPEIENFGRSALERPSFAQDGIFLSADSEVHQADLLQLVGPHPRVEKIRASLEEIHAPGVEDSTGFKLQSSLHAA